jgi:hypothetical protein
VSIVVMAVVRARGLGSPRPAGAHLLGGAGACSLGQPSVLCNMVHLFRRALASTIYARIGQFAYDASKLARLPASFDRRPDLPGIDLIDLWTGQGVKKTSRVSRFSR